MPILDLQMKLRQLGRIRTGEVITTKKGARAPSKLDHFRITSLSEAIIRQVAELYGGEPAPWIPENSTESQWAVTVTADRIPILLPPQSITQYYELWSGGGCVRRCDGETEQKTGKRCLCDPDPKKRQCAVTTRLSVILREVQGLGVFRLDSHGYYAATELPQVAAFLEYAGTYVEAYLALEKRKDIKDGLTRHWMTPVLDVDITPQQMLAAAATGQLGAGQGSITPPDHRPALTSGGPPPSARAAVAVLDVDSVTDAINECLTPDALRDLWRDLNHDGALDDPRNVDVASAFKTRAEAIKPPPEGKAPEGKAPPEPDVAPDPEIEQLWQQIAAACPKEWSSDKLEGEFESAIGVTADEATADHMRTYLELSRGPA